MASISKHFKPQIIEVGDGMYFVESESIDGDYHAVDLMHYEGNGSCTCEDWTCRIGPCRKAGVTPQKQTCKHIDWAAQDWNIKIRRAYAELLKQGKLDRPKWNEIKGFTRTPIGTAQLTEEER